MMLIRKEIEKGTLLNFLEENSYSIIGKFKFDRNLNEDEILKAISTKIMNILSDRPENDIRLFLLDRDKLIGAVNLIWSKWDTNHFNMKIGKVDLCIFDSKADLTTRITLLKNLIHESKMKNFNLLIARIPMTDILTVIAFEKIGGYLSDILVTFQRDTSDFSYLSIINKRVDLTEASDEDIFSLCDIARKTFKFDHFHSDPNLPSQLCDELYAEWVRNSFNGLVDKIFVAKINQKILGFVTCKIESLTQKCNFGVIELIGVDPKISRKGIGSLLINKALNWFAGFVPSVYVGTQVQNMRAMRLYTRLGFEPVYSEATLHLWIS